MYDTLELIEHAGEYWLKDHSGGYPRRLTNFTIRLRGVYGSDRRVSLIREGYETRPFNLGPMEAANKSYFRKAVMTHGHFFFFGGEADLARIWEHVAKQLDAAQLPLLGE